MRKKGCWLFCECVAEPFNAEVRPRPCPGAAPPQTRPLAAARTCGTARREGMGGGGGGRKIL